MPVVKADVPVLLGLPQMDLLGIYLNNLENRLMPAAYRQSVPMTLLFGHAFLQWNPHIACHFTTI